MASPVARLLGLGLALALAAPLAFGDSFYGGNPISAVLSSPNGAYTLATLPPAATSQAKYAFVSDLGGGADMVLSDGVNWKHIRQGVVTNIPIASTITVTPLASPPVIQLTGSGFSTASLISISPTGLYPGYTLHVVVPSNVLSTVVGLLGSVGVSAGGGASMPVAGGTWEDLQWNGSALVEIGKGTL